MQTTNVGLTLGTFDDDKYEEEWMVVINTGGQYTLSKVQAKVLQQEIANGNRGIVLFQTFSISIPYIAEFYMIKRFLKNAYQLPERATEAPYKPISPERWEEIKKKLYKNIGNLSKLKNGRPI